jgi:hypothetical protein
MLTFQQLSLAERRIAKQQWHFMAQRGMDATVRHVEQTYYATWSMATLMARSTPTTQSWPFVTLADFDEWSWNDKNQ